MGSVTFIYAPPFQAFIFLTLIGVSDVRGELSVPENVRCCAIQIKTWSPIVLKPSSSIIQMSRCVLCFLLPLFDERNEHIC